MTTFLANDFAVVRLETKEGPFYGAMANGSRLPIPQHVVEQQIQDKQKNLKPGDYECAPL